MKSSPLIRNLPTTRLLLASAMLASVGVSTPARAADLFWDGELSSQWFDSTLIGIPITNWDSDTLPGLADTVNFDQGFTAGARYLVDGVAATHDRLLVHNDALELLLPAANKLTLSNAGSNSPGVTVGVSSGDVGDLLLSGGAVASVLGSIGEDAGATGVVTLQNTAVWTNSRSLFVGDSGTGTLNIQDGGSVSNKVGLIGNTSTGNGTATVTGIGSA